jgi:signal transduction histidine kinase
MAVLPHPVRDLPRTDGALAAGLGVLAGLTAAVQWLVAGAPVPSWGEAAALAWVLVSAGAWAWRRRAPATALAVHALTGLAVPLGVEHVLALYWVLLPGVDLALQVSLRSSRTVAVAAVVGAALAQAAYGPLWGEPVDLGVAALAAAPGVFGGALRVRRALARSRLLRAQRAAWAREREAVAAERARLARDVHDVVAHHVSSMVVSAGAAHLVYDKDRAGAREALAFLERTATETTTAMRDLVGLLAEATAEPPPGLADLDGLADRFRAAGCQVTVTVDGPVDDLPRDLALSAYRVVQEGLTNALKHAGPVPVQVRVWRGAGVLEVQVEDAGGGGAVLPGLAGSGQGLVGMRERAALFRGSAVAAPLSGGGWRVRATFPV